MASLRVGPLTVASALNLTNAATTVPTANSNGVAIPGGKRHEYMHLVAAKTNVCDVDVYALIPITTAQNVWAYADSVSFAKNATEMARITGLTGALRVCPVRTDANVSNTGCNLFFAFSEALGA